MAASALDDIARMLNQLLQPGQQPPLHSVGSAASMPAPTAVNAAAAHQLPALSSTVAAPSGAGIQASMQHPGNGMQAETAAATVVLPPAAGTDQHGQLLVTDTLPHEQSMRALLHALLTHVTAVHEPTPAAAVVRATPGLSPALHADPACMPLTLPNPASSMQYRAYPAERPSFHGTGAGYAHTGGGGGMSSALNDLLLLEQLRQSVTSSVLDAIKPQVRACCMGAVMHGVRTQGVRSNVYTRAL